MVRITERRKLSPSLPTLPFDLIPEILCRLPVKFLLQFRCVCKSWKSLISDYKFAKKHLTLSTTYTLHYISNTLLRSYTLDSVLTNISRIPYPFPNSYVFSAGSCNGILSLVNNTVKDREDGGVDLLIVFKLWNPSIRKLKELPPLISVTQKFPSMYGLGYDPISDNYKFVVVFGDFTYENLSKTELMHQVKVHILGTDSWKNVLEFPFAFVSARRPSGQYLSGTINWLLFMGSKRFIASFDLGNESYREVLLPDGSGTVDKDKLILSVMRDCLCLISGEDVWILKEYGNKESWTKLFTISCMQDPRASSYSYIKAVFVIDDEQVLLRYRDDKRRGHISYNCKDDTSKFIELQIIGGEIPQVCVESLISPCF